MPAAEPIENLAERVRAGDLRALARAATLIEAQTEAGRALLAALFRYTGRARIIGITGPPGAGKSTLVDQLATTIRARGQTLGVLAVDPSSSLSHGAILGDRIRMGGHHADPGVFIRSMATRGRLGGLARATLDLALLLDAAGRDYVLVETVGVGQDEVEIGRMAGITLVVLVPNMGDDVQAIKAGIMEIADAFVINKSDLPGAAQLENEIRTMQSLGEQPSRAEAAPVRRVTALAGQGIAELLELVDRLWERRAQAASQHELWTMRLRELLAQRLLQAIEPEALAAHAARVAEKTEDPYAAVEALMAEALPKQRASDAHRALPVELDHIGVAVRSLDESLRFFEDLLGMEVAGRETIASEQVHVAMLPAAPAPARCRVELLEAADEQSAIAKFIEKRGPGLHHLALRVDDLAASAQKLAAAGARLLSEPRAGAGGHRYVFVHPASAGGLLLELIQK